MCVPGTVSLGELEQQPPTGAPVQRIAPRQHWGGVWCFPWSIEQHPGVASGGTLGPCGAEGCLIPPPYTKPSLDWGAWKETSSLWEGVRVCCKPSPQARRGFIGRLGWGQYPPLGCCGVGPLFQHRIPLVLQLLGLCSRLSRLCRGFFPPPSCGGGPRVPGSRDRSAGEIAWMLSAAQDKHGPLTGGKANARLAPDPAWEPLLRDATLRSDSSGSCRGYLFNLSLAC